MMRLEVGDQISLSVLKELLRQPIELESRDTAIIINPQHTKLIKHNKRFNMYTILLTDDTTVTISYDSDMRISKIEVDYG